MTTQRSGCNLYFRRHADLAVPLPCPQSKFTYTWKLVEPLLKDQYYMRLTRAALGCSHATTQRCSDAAPSPAGRTSSEASAASSAEAPASEAPGQQLVTVLQQYVLPVLMTMQHHMDVGGAIEAGSVFHASLPEVKAQVAAAVGPAGPFKALLQLVEERCKAALGAGSSASTSSTRASISSTSANTSTSTTTSASSSAGDAGSSRSSAGSCSLDLLALEAVLDGYRLGSREHTANRLYHEHRRHPTDAEIDRYLAASLEEYEVACEMVLRSATLACVLASTGPLCSGAGACAPTYLACLRLLQAAGHAHGGTLAASDDMPAVCLERPLMMQLLADTCELCVACAVSHTVAVVH